MIKAVAENINIMSKYTGDAIRERDPKPILEWAEKLTQRGADVLDLNLGPARKGGPEMMQWLGPDGAAGYRSAAFPGHHQ